MCSTPVLELDDVTFRRDGNQIIDGICMTVRAGEHWAMLGPNGAGKSTVLGFCGADTHPTSGVVRVLGEQLGRVELQRLRRRIGHVDPRHRLRSPLSVRDVVLTGLTGSIDIPQRWTPTAGQCEAAAAMIETVGMATKIDRTWPTLSQGERGRALIARALVTEPELLLLDEPSTGLDIAAREQLLHTIDMLGRTHPQMASMLVTHNLEELPSSTTHAVLIAEGRTIADGPARKTITTANISAAFDHPVHVEYRDQRWTARSPLPHSDRLAEAIDTTVVQDAAAIRDSRARTTIR